MVLAQSATDECSLAGIVTTCIVEEAQKVSYLIINDFYSQTALNAKFT